MPCVRRGTPYFGGRCRKTPRPKPFVPPTLIELDSIRTLKREVFGPVLHVVRFRRDKLDALLEDIRATGYGLTFSVHSRIDETIERVIDGVRAGNIYVNRNMIGAVVGVQPFGGEGLSGTGPKAGGPTLCATPVGGLPSPSRIRRRAAREHGGADRIARLADGGWRHALRRASARITSILRHCATSRSCQGRLES